MQRVKGLGGRDKDGYVPTTKENCVSRELVAEGDALTERVEQFQTDLENAQRECGNKLNARGVDRSLCKATKRM